MSEHMHKGVPMSVLKDGTELAKAMAKTHEYGGNGLDNIHATRYPNWCIAIRWSTKIAAPVIMFTQEEELSV